jgi:hypothetical protein
MRRYNFRDYPGQDVGAVCRDAYLEFVKANGEEPILIHMNETTIIIMDDKKGLKK